jgi:hypothetical protein
VETFKKKFYLDALTFGDATDTLSQTVAENYPLPLRTSQKTEDAICFLIDIGISLHKYKPGNTIGKKK